MKSKLGKLLRSAVMNGKIHEVDILLEKGADINYNMPDGTSPYGGTPLNVAASFGNMKMVKHLIERGANVETKDLLGFRPYITAKYSDSKNSKEIAAYLKSIESEELHNLKNKLEQLEKYALSDDLLAFLQSDKLLIELSENEFDLYEIIFYSLIDTVETEFLGKKLLLISKDVDGGSFELVWDKEAKCLGYIDIEHGACNIVCSFEEFMNNPTLYAVKIANGEYE